MSTFTRLFGVSGFIPLVYHQVNNQNRQKVNECQGSADAQAAADDLQKIFEEGAQAGLSQEELMEMMMEKRSSLKPFPFEKLMQNTAMFKQHEAVDGVSLNTNFPMGQQFQLGGTWTLSNSKGASFEMVSSINNSSGSPYQSQDEVHQMVFRFASD